MLLNYFKTAWRNIRKNKVYTLINMLGLVLGMCAFIVIYLIVTYEYSFDTFHPAKDRIYRVMAALKDKRGETLNFYRTPDPVSPIARTTFTGVDAVAGLIPYDASINIHNGKEPAGSFDNRISGVNYPVTAIVEPQYFDIFKYRWLAGDPATALGAPFTVVLLESKAKKYFGPIPPENMIGKEIIYGDSLSVRVTGILKDWSGNTDLPFTDFISFNTIKSSFLRASIDPDSWGLGEEMARWTFVRLNPGTKPAQLENELNQLVATQWPPDARAKHRLWLEPLSQIHFDSNVIENEIRTADLQTLHGLIIVALFILVLAIVNFINLATAQSQQRSKEIGIRKIFGSGRVGLMTQFLVETFVVTFAVVVISAALVSPVLNAFASFVPPGVKFDLLNPETYGFLLSVALLTTILAGLYPARILSSFSPVTMLKSGGTQKGGERGLLRKGLIVFQFTISLVFIIGTIVIREQLKYARSRDLGFSSDAIISLRPNWWHDSVPQIKLFSGQIKQIPGVSAVALEMLAPMDRGDRAMRVKINGVGDSVTGVAMRPGNEDFIPLYELKLLAGRNLLPVDSLKEFVINESYARELGFPSPEKALGKMLYYNDKPYPVVGVIADFHQKNFHEHIKPLVIVNRPELEKNLAIKLTTKDRQPGDLQRILASMEQIWKPIFPNAPFTYTFYDDTIALLYEHDTKTAQLINTAMAISIFISLMGLFGLAMYTTQRRTKEIGIRKVHGASVLRITLMLNKEFLTLIGIAFAISCPIGWYIMNQWLDSFVYHIRISPWMLLLAGLMALFVSMLTVSWKAAKAAMTHPADVLRSE